MTVAHHCAVVPAFAGATPPAGLSIPFTANTTQLPQSAVDAFNTALDELIISGNLSTYGVTVYIPSQRPTTQCSEFLSQYDAQIDADAALTPLDSSDMVRPLVISCCAPRFFCCIDSCWTCSSLAATPCPRRYSFNQAGIFIVQACGAAVALLHHVASVSKRAFAKRRSARHEVNGLRAGEADEKEALAVEVGPRCRLIMPAPTPAAR